LGQAGEFQEAPAHLALELEPDQKQVSAQGGPDLDEHGILGSAVKGLDFSSSISWRPVSARAIAPAANFSDLFPRGLAMALNNLKINKGQTGNTGEPHRQTEAGTSCRR